MHNLSNKWCLFYPVCALRKSKNHEEFFSCPCYTPLFPPTVNRFPPNIYSNAKGMDKSDKYLQLQN